MNSQRFLAEFERASRMTMAAVAVFIVLVSVCFMWWAFERGRQEVGTEMAAVAADKADDVEHWLVRQQTELLQPVGGYLASIVREMRRQPVPLARQAEYRQRLVLYQRRNLEIAQIELFDTQGLRLLALHDETSDVLSGVAGKLSGLGRVPSLAPSEQCRLPGGQQCFAIISSLFDQTAQGPVHLGYAVFSIDLERTLMISVGKWYGKGTSAQAGLLWTNRLALARQGEGRDESGWLAGIDAAALRAGAAGLVAGQLFRIEGSGTSAYAVVQPLRGMEWSVVVLLERAVVLRKIWREILMLVAFEILLLAGAATLFRYWHGLRSARTMLREKQREQSFLQAFLDHLPGIAFVKDSAGRVLLANSGFDRELGIPHNSMIGRTNCEIFPGEFGEKLDRDDRRIMDSGQNERIEEEYGGRIFETSKFVMTDERGQRQLGGISLDVTDRLRATRRVQALLKIAELAESVDEKTLLTEGLELAQTLTNSRIGFLHFVNDDQESLELAIWTAGALKGCTAVFDSHYPLSQAGIWADCARQRRPMVFNDYAACQQKRGLPEGHARLDRLISLPVIEGGMLCVLIGVGNKSEDYGDWDIECLQLIGNQIWLHVRRGRAEAALRKATRVIEASPIVCFRWRAEAGWPVDYVSANIARWGYRSEDLLAGRIPFVNLIHPDDLARVAEEVATYTAAGRADYVQEYRLLTADGRVLWVEDVTSIERDAQGRAVAYNGLLGDISERKAMQSNLDEQMSALRSLNKRLEEAQAQLLQSEKLAAIGQLAAGVAHELNNPIGFVHSNLGSLTDYVRTLIAIADACPGEGNDAVHCPHLHDILRLKKEEDYAFIRGDIFSLLDESRDGLQRVRKIVQDLRDFSRSGSQDWGWANLHVGLESTLNIVRNELKYKCTVIKEYGELPEVYCVLSQLNQVFMNLLVNAAQAIQDKGEITLRTGREGDDRVWITISDTGQGIAPENLRRIFEPFFTTKPVGTGTGLGLSLVYGIIERHRGKISVDSEIGRGTTFRIVLPVRAPDEQPSEPLDPADGAENNEKRGEA